MTIGKSRVSGEENTTGEHAIRARLLEYFVKAPNRHSRRRNLTLHARSDNSRMENEQELSTGYLSIKLRIPSPDCPRANCRS